MERRRAGREGSRGGGGGGGCGGGSVGSVGSNGSRSGGGGQGERRCYLAVGEMGDPGPEVSGRELGRGVLGRTAPEGVFCRGWGGLLHGRGRGAMAPSAPRAEPSFRAWCLSERGTRSNNGRPASPDPLHRLGSSLCRCSASGSDILRWDCSSVVSLHPRRRRGQGNPRGSAAPCTPGHEPTDCFVLFLAGRSCVGLGSVGFPQELFVLESSFFVSPFGKVFPCKHMAE